MFDNPCSQLADTRPHKDRNCVPNTNSELQEWRRRLKRTEAERSNSLGRPCLPEALRACACVPCCVNWARTCGTREIGIDTMPYLLVCHMLRWTSATWINRTDKKRSRRRVSGKHCHCMRSKARPGAPSLNEASMMIKYWKMERRSQGVASLTKKNKRTSQSVAPSMLESWKDRKV